jgi:hypothetical protein
MLDELEDAGLLHTQQARTFMQLMRQLVYSWHSSGDGYANRTHLLLPLLQQLQHSIRCMYATQAASGGSSSSSSRKERMSAQAAATLIQLQSAFVVLAEYCVGDVQGMSEADITAAAAAAHVSMFNAEVLREAYLQQLAGACCCWHQQHVHWQQQQQQQEGQAAQQQQQQQLPPLQRTWLCRRVLQLRGSDAAAPKIPYWGPGYRDLLHFSAEGCTEYTQAVWHSWQQRSSTDLLDRTAHMAFIEGTSAAVEMLTLWQQILGESPRAVLPAEVQLTADAVLLLYWRLQEVERQQQQQQQQQPGQQHQLIFNAPLQSREGRLLMAIKRVQQLLDLQLAAAARSIAAGVAQQSPQWAWKAVLLGSLIEAQRTVAAVAGGSQPSSRPRGAAVAVEQPSACAQRLLQRLPKVLSSEGELQTNVWLRALHTAAEQGRCTMSVNSICIFG